MAELTVQCAPEPEPLLEAVHVALARAQELAQQQPSPERAQLVAEKPGGAPAPQLAAQRQAQGPPVQEPEPVQPAPERVPPQSA